ncbi:hypothetical protein E2562_019361 [Oryza meyeriana var. granulata]|uniref:DUF834 domain-containing protein n=1 Tax=Oryza meyeriana var. granulata TaxID=110450 RepID=A0A6G1BLR2_9ORYZ|nr:hypothetical protein E2562_019361 [Oryza meyeriana var. granulata]
MVSSSSDPKTRRGTKDRADLAEEDLVGVGAVDVRGVEEGDAAVEGVGDDNDVGVEEAERGEEPEAAPAVGESCGLIWSGSPPAAAEEVGRARGGGGSGGAGGSD